MISVLDQARNVLITGGTTEKPQVAQDLAGLSFNSSGVSIAPPDRPARPDRPSLVPPKDVPRRRLGTVEGRIALLHAVAHIEFNAIDLAADMMARFARSERIRDEDRQDFITDWVSVCRDEARHFDMIRGRLQALGADYGDHPAHDGLWDAAQSTQGNLLARLVIAPMVLEARGLDVTPAMINKFRGHGDNESADILQVIYDDEIGHVGFGVKWFHKLCAQEGRDPEATFQDLVAQYFRGGLKPPFNIPARDSAGMPQSYYQIYASVV